MALNNLPFIHTIKKSPAIFRQRFQRDQAKTLSHGDPAFRVQYVGTEQVYSLREEEASQVVEQLVSPHLGKGCRDHVLVVRPRYLEVKELSSGRQLTKTYLHDVACCMTDRAHPDVFLYVCKSKRQLQCRVFRCGRREKAQAVTVCLAKVFEAAFSQWHAAYSQGSLPSLSPGSQPLAEGRPAPLDKAGRPREEEPEADSDEELELRMHREFLHRAASLRAPHRLDAGSRDLVELSGEGEEEQVQLAAPQPS
ncbi:low density lipoprotein receptor adapter protein 1-A [Narcine bancroftii]|uniref:low density lipoprotein receptor adapter protein 1-A n=1 Tax=Narcine bancroftii TaxID=1343680 RepID=UPI003831F89A